MSKKIRWGILGCGKIANKFASDLKLVEDARLSAIASRDAVKLQSFSQQYKPEFAFNNYEALVKCAELDAIYVATPHGMHYEHVMLCLKNRKAVLCEKAFALNLAHAREMVEFARRQKVFLMEAFWTKFLPQYEKVMDIIRSGTIGEVKLIQSDFGFK
ncbi:MAG: Gfo/Idh/MocA family oxidoreductase, partial [Cyclobacteriaceae bacterium]